MREGLPQVSASLSPFQVAPSAPASLVLTLQGPLLAPADHMGPSSWHFLADGCRAWLSIFSLSDAPWGWEGVSLWLRVPPSQGPEETPNPPSHPSMYPRPLAAAKQGSHFRLMPGDSELEGC